MNNLKIISKVGGAIAIVSILFMPVVGCGGDTANGIDLVQSKNISGDIKACIVVCMLCGLLILLLRTQIQQALSGIIGIVALLGGYMLAKDKLQMLDLKAGYYLSLMGFALTTLVSFLKPSLNDNSVQAAVNANMGKADELHKLKALLDNNAITQEEYDEQKRKLLS